MRLGLCCKFVDEPIRFRTATVTSLARLSQRDARQKLSQLCLTNASSLARALHYCAEQGIGAFRINSQILPAKTHPATCYRVKELPDGKEIIDQFEECGRFARDRDIRTLFHPDQFILLSSADDRITRRSIEELDYHAEVAEWTGADVINIHGGGAYGNKQEALERVRRNLKRLSTAVKTRLTFENDDRVYTPADLLPLCRDAGIPFVYDVHHHRCLPDGLSIDDTTQQALATWNREPVFHVSSPKAGWRGPNPSRHHDYIQPRDIPVSWLDLDVTVEIEAKAKEHALRRLTAWLARRR